MRSHAIYGSLHGRSFRPLSDHGSPLPRGLCDRRTVLRCRARDGHLLLLAPERNPRALTDTDERRLA